MSITLTPTVYELCLELGAIIASGGFCLFHDFHDFRNRDQNDRDYGVYQAVMDGLDKERFEFYGIYGCAGLYRLVHNILYAVQQGAAPNHFPSRLADEDQLYLRSQ